MTKIKALCLVGLASLAASTGAATAADLPLPPPPVLAPPPLIAVGSGFYLRSDVGVGINDLRTRSSTFDADFDQYTAGVGYDRRSADDTTFIDAGVGYRFNNYLRADVTGEYRNAVTFSALESYTDNTQPSGRQYDLYNGEIRSAVGLLNGYVDIGTWYGVTPFVGAGVGVANVTVRHLTDISPNGGFGFASDHSQTNFAYALMAGLDFAVTPAFTVELGYRFLDEGYVSSGQFTCANYSGGGCQEVQHSHLTSNDIRLGFRYAFLDLVPVRVPVIARY